MRQSVTKNTKDSPGKRLGVKKFGGEEVKPSQIIIRQRGFKYKPGENVTFGRDQTLHASKEGKVTFTTDPWYPDKKKVYVHVIEQEVPNRKVFPPKPFIYHPELYPELAKNNIKQERLKLKERNNITKVEKNNDLKVIRSGMTETKMNDLISLLSKIKQNKVEYTSKYQIEPILNEISEIGRKYFSMQNIPDDSILPEDESFNHGKVINDELVEDPMYLYKNNLKKEILNNPMNLRELMKSMQDNGEISNSYDLRGLPYELDIKKNLKSNNKNELIEKRNKILTLLNQVPEEEKKSLKIKLNKINNFTKDLGKKMETLDKNELKNKAYISKLIKEKYKQSKNKRNIKKSIKI